MLFSFQIPFFLFFNICFALDIESEAERKWSSLEKTHEPKFDLISPYVDEYLQLKNWDFGRDTIVEANKFVRLTRDVQSQDGWLWLNHQIGLKDWALEFSFKVAHEGSLSGDGFAFWVTDTPKMTGSVFGNTDYFRGVGVFFDTYPNSRIRHTYPYIMAMIGDGTVHYDHDFDGTSQEAGGCHTEFRNRQSPSIARVRYILGTLSMDILVGDTKEWTQCFSFNVELPPEYYIGFSGMTGGVTSQQDITKVIGYSLKVDPNAKRAQPDKAPTSSPASGKKKDASSGNYQSQNNNNQKSGGGGILATLGYIILFIIFSVVAYAGYVYYKQSQRNNYKRF